MTNESAVTTRPDGRAYRMRGEALHVRAWESDDALGVIMFGTLDPDQAEARAAELSGYWYGPGATTNATPGWWRDTFSYGSRQWAADEKRGTPGVMFTWEQS